MNRNLQDLILKFATTSHRTVVNSLLDSSKDAVIAMLMDLMSHYFNDKNSSSLREMVIVTLCGYQVTGKKIGYNGYRQDSITGKTLHCEAKPKSINTNDKNSKPLNGAGNFTDYTWGRFERDKNSNPTIITGGFIDGKLIYVFEFPFTTPSFLDRLESLLLKDLPDGDIKRKYCRSANFGLDDYSDALNQGNVSLFVSKSDLSEFKPHLTRKLYELLEGYCHD